MKKKCLTLRQTPSRENHQHLQFWKFTNKNRGRGGKCYQTCLQRLLHSLLTLLSGRDFSGLCFMFWSRQYKSWSLTTVLLWKVLRAKIVTGEHARLTSQSFLLAKALRKTYKNNKRTWDSAEVYQNLLCWSYHRASVRGLHS